MPRGDRTGPAGFGPMTGRGMGFCAGANAPGYMSGGFGMGRGLGRGAGRGQGRGFGPRFGYGQGFRSAGWAGFAGPYPADAHSYGRITPSEEADILKSQAEDMEQALQGIRKRLDELDSAE